MSGNERQWVLQMPAILLTPPPTRNFRKTDFHPNAVSLLWQPAHAWEQSTIAASLFAPLSNASPHSLPTSPRPSPPPQDHDFLNTFPTTQIELFETQWPGPRLVLLSDLFLSTLLTNIYSKPPASLLEVDSFTLFSLSNPDFLVSGKAPRKQLATKAARKTAAVRNAFLVVP